MNIIIDEYGTIFKKTREGVYTPEKDIKENEIMKENNKIERLSRLYSIDSPEDFDYTDFNFDRICEKINEIINYINKD